MHQRSLPPILISQGMSNRPCPTRISLIAIGGQVKLPWHACCCDNPVMSLSGREDGTDGPIFLFDGSVVFLFFPNFEGEEPAEVTPAPPYVGPLVTFSIQTP